MPFTGATPPDTSSRPGESGLDQISLEDGAVNPGSAIASLWLQVKHDRQPVSLPPVISKPLFYCPRCHHSLSPPAEPWSRQNCTYCGWIS